MLAGIILRHLDANKEFYFGIFVITALLEALGLRLEVPGLALNSLEVLGLHPVV